MQLRFEAPKDVKFEMLSRQAALYPFHTYARMLRITADALSVAIRSGSVLYAHCIRNVSVDFRCDPLRSAAIRSPILKVISCFTYAADAADNVNPY